MVVKTERFEMRLDEATFSRIDAWRSNQNDLPSRAEAMRRLVELGLMRDANAGKTVNFSDGERLLIMMMRDIYKGLKLKTGEIDPDFVADVIFGGHYWAPMWEMQGLFHNSNDDPADVTFVVDVLDMWEFMESAFEKLSVADKTRLATEAAPFGKDVRFYGFDGNNESGHMGITRFLVEKMGRFSRFKGRELNSHRPVIGQYRRMFAEFEPMRSTLVGKDLSVDQLIKLLRRD